MNPMDSISNVLSYGHGITSTGYVRKTSIISDIMQAGIRLFYYSDTRITYCINEYNIGELSSEQDFMCLANSNLCSHLGLKKSIAV